MNENEELKEQLARMEKKLDSLQRYVTAQKIRTYVIAGICILLIAALALWIVPKVNAVVRIANDFKSEVEAFKEQISDINLDGAREALEKIGEIDFSVFQQIDFSGLNEKIQAIDFAGIQNVLDKVKSIDVDSINGTVDKLNTVLEPLTRLFGKS